MKQIRLILGIIKECWYFLFFTLKYNASINTDASLKKMQYTLMRENHVIEKGMSMKNPRKGFGQQKVMNLIQRLSKYTDLYVSQDEKFLSYPLSTIFHYIQYTKSNGIDIEPIEKSYQELCNKLNSKGCIIEINNILAGIKEQKGSDIVINKDKPFPEFVKTRHSVRYFKNEIISKDIIERVLLTARYTPSACNRQGWHTHIFINEQAHKLIKMQEGAKGCENDIHMAIIVTADASAFLYHEIHQPYIDGGLYAMSLIYALHAEGIGCIPLSCGFYMSKLNKIKKEFQISGNEIPIVILGIGVLHDTYNVAISTRQDISRTNIFHY